MELAHGREKLFEELRSNFGDVKLLLEGLSSSGRLFRKKGLDERLYNNDEQKAAYREAVGEVLTYLRARAGPAIDNATLILFIPVGYGPRVGQGAIDPRSRFSRCPW